MTSTAAAQFGTIAKPAPRFSPTAILGNLLGRLVQADQKYRFSRQADETSDHMLDDMGITRQELDQALNSWPRY